MVKRENSDGAHHVVFPKNAKSVVSIEKGGSYQWIAQEMMPLLQKWGEYHVIFVGETPLYTMITTPQKHGEWLWDELKPYSLEALRCVMVCMAVTNTDTDV